MSGRDLSRELDALYPELRMIHMSGHTAGPVREARRTSGRTL